MSAPEFEDEGSLPWLGLYLNRKNVAEIEAWLSGGGDEGQIDDIEYLSRDGERMPGHAITEDLRSRVLHSGSAHPRDFHQCLQEIIDDFADSLGDYVNNEGGSIHLRLGVSESGITMTEGHFTPGEYDDEFDDDEFEDDGGDIDIHDPDLDGMEP